MISPRTEFQALWMLSATRLLTRGVRVETGPPPGHPPLVTTVIRVPVQLAGSIQATLASFALQPPEHHFYPPTTLHVSVSGFTSALPADLDLIERRVAEVMDATAPFEIELGGVNLSPSTVLIQAFASHDALADVRQRVSDALLDRPALRITQRRFPSRHISFVNVVRFLGPVDARPLLRDLKRFREQDFGKFRVREIQLVTTDKVLSDNGTEMLRSFPIN